METHDSQFTFGGYTIHNTTDAIDFRYTIVHSDRTIDFVEKLIVPQLYQRGKLIPEPLLTGILDSLSLLLGISYWKLYCPSDIDLGPIMITLQQAQFWNTVYTKGLGEFFYRNRIDYRNLVNFPSVKTTAPAPVEIDVQEQSLVQLGGGKDSIVTSELLKTTEKDFTLVCVDAHELHRNIAQAIGKPLFEVKRIIDPQLYELNKQPGTYNGHIPISAVYAFVDLLVAALYGYGFIIASNEESANYGNVTYMGEEINHQWSKTLEFEMLFQSYVLTHITPSITYFSLLRPIKEIKIVELFSQYEQYFPFFSSCNTNFRRTVSSATPRWCGECPKCLFVFLLLSAFLPKKNLIVIFGRNLYEDTSLLPLFRELLGLTGIKPFECVGTPEETRLGLYLVGQKKEYGSDIVVQTLRKELEKEWDQIGMTEKELLGMSDKHKIPEKFQDVLYEIERTRK